MRKSLKIFPIIALLSVCTTPLRADATPDIQRTDLGGGISMLTGKGGNLAVSVGADGVFVVDDQYAVMADKIKAAIAAQTDAPIRFVINTHWHGDHTGGNEAMGKAGAVIVAHENVRKSLSDEQFIAAFNMRSEPYPEVAKPVVTFTRDISFHWNDETIDVCHVAPAHTDGDSIVKFARANVIHAGDTFFNGMYPFIDAGTGGNLDGMIAAADKILSWADADTKIIPGHGPLANRADLAAYRLMLVKVRSVMQPLIDAGQTREQVIAAKPTAALDAQWGGGFLKPDVWVGIVYDAMQ